MKSNQIIFDEDDLPNARVWDVTELGEDGQPLEGPLLVTFDRENVLNLWQDFPSKFTKEQIEVFKEEMPYWYDFFKDRLTPDQA